jgi:SagB-type dehydrogenase family enzyme
MSLEAPVKDNCDDQRKQPGIGERFQEETKYSPDKMRGHPLDWDQMPDRFKSYPESTPRISLPKPDLTKDAKLWDVILKRRSGRNYMSDLGLPLNTLSTLLWATQGVTADAGGFQFRSAPSAGALYPIETYLLARAVEGLDQGIYHFRPQAFDIEFIQSGDFSRRMAQAALGQGMVANAQVTFIWTAIVERSKWKYRQRAYRYIYLDAGHIAQNLYLAGTAEGLGVCGIGALYDDIVNAIISVDGIEETVVYMASVGYSCKPGG